jgi:hypothetical protein
MNAELCHGCGGGVALPGASRRGNGKIPRQSTVNVHLRHSSRSCPECDFVKLGPIGEIRQMRCRALNRFGCLKENGGGIPSSGQQLDAFAFGQINGDDEIAAADRPFLEIDRKSPRIVGFRRILKTRYRLCRHAQAGHADGHAVACKDFTEAFADDRGDAPSP